MTSFHKSVSTATKDQEEKKNTAVAKLEQFLLERRGARQPVDDLEEFERELHSLFATAEAEVVGHEVKRFDIDLPFVTVDGIVHQRVLRCEDTYFCASGPVQVMRSLYSTRKDQRGRFVRWSCKRDWWKGVGHRMRRNKRRGSYRT